jgi:transposase InsO family protein
VASELQQAGYHIQTICEVVGVSRSGFYRWRQRQAGAGFSDRKYLGSRDPAGDAQILASIKVIKLRHPFWGYRRVRAWLKYREGLPVGYKRVYRLMKENELLVPQKRYRATRQPTGHKPRAHRPGQFWGIDMTKFIIPNIGWAYLVIVLDWFSRRVVGWQLSWRCRSQEWRQALEDAVLQEFPQGVRGQGLKLVSDNGCQPTSGSFLKVTAILDIEQIFTSFNNPKGNAETERFMRTLKEELLWLEEFGSLEEAREKLSAWIEFYNKDYLHSALGYKSPQEYERLYQETDLVRAA